MKRKVSGGNRVFIILLPLLFISAKIVAQSDTVISGDDLLSELANSDTSSPVLLPRHMFITQRLLWGPHGMMRGTDYFKLEPEKRQRELKLRRIMLTTHQILGFATLGCMIAQGIVGTKLYNGDRSVKDLHEGLAAAINAGYFTTAGLAFFTPPKVVPVRKGLSTIKVHKALAVIHFSAMIATNVLSDGAESEYGKTGPTKALHRAAAFTAFGAFAAAMIVIKF